jgi:hypothetical protein
VVLEPPAFSISARFFFARSLKVSTTKRKSYTQQTYNQQHNETRVVTKQAN